MDDLEFTPDEIAEYLFSNQPGPSCSNQMVASLFLDNNDSNDDLDEDIKTTDLFEI